MKRTKHKGSEVKNTLLIFAVLLFALIIFAGYIPQSAKVGAPTDSKVVANAPLTNYQIQPNLVAPSASYPISSDVATTVERVIVPVSVPSSSPSIHAYDVSNFSEYGYGVWKYEPGLGYEKRLDIMPATYNKTSATNTAKLLNFFTISDIHITDKESPAEAIYYGYRWGIISGYSPAMLYTTQMLDATIQTINALHKQNPFDFGISLGDDINSGQYNELRWFIDVLDGKNIIPDSGVRNDPVPGPLNDYQDEYKAAGLDKSINWYQTLGNHDHFWMGMFMPDEYVKSSMVGDTILNQGNIFTNKIGIKSRGFYMGAIDGRTQYGNIIGAGPVAEFDTAPTTPADSNRHFISKSEWMGEFFNTTSNPVGHGFNQTNAMRGFASYSFEPKSDVPIKVIVLDDTQIGNESDGETNMGHGSIDQERYDWLVKELDQGQAQNKLMIIATHIPISAKISDSGLDSLMVWDPKSAVSESDLIAKFHTYPNLILVVAGHRHGNTVTALKSPDPNRPELGFWEVETSSLREFPQQFRTFQIVRNSDNTISIFANNVDQALRNDSLIANARTYAVAAREIFNVSIEPSPSGAYNVELVKQLSPQMQTNIQKYGTPMGK
ncbi:MAG: TIGR03768 family metallophosphoesterase [Candidatus Micrarchaeia archaeon]